MHDSVMTAPGDGSPASPLTREAMLEASAARVGLNDFGTGFEDGLDRVLEDIRKLGLAPAYAERTARKLGSFLDARLHAEQGWKDHPDSLKTPVVRPLVIAGLVRSGTTALHKLMSMDPQFQVPEYWLTFAPMPRPPRAEWMNIPVYRSLGGYLDEQVSNAPEIHDNHGQAVNDAEESIYLLAQNFTNNMFATLWDVPDYDAWYRRHDETHNYERMADILRLIGYREPQKRWLLKNPTDLFSMDALLNAFPDAMIVQTHRDPIQAIPSIGTLIHGARKAMSGPDADPVHVGMRENSFWIEGLHRSVKARERAPDQFFDVEFKEFVGDQLGTVRAIYDKFGLTLSAEVEARMQAWLDSNPRKSQTMQRVAPEDFGLSKAGLEADYADYRSWRGYA